MSYIPWIPKTFTNSDHKIIVTLCVTLLGNIDQPKVDIIDFMDIYIYTGLDKIEHSLKENEFIIKQKKNH